MAVRDINKIKKALSTEDPDTLIRVLDQYKGSYAVEYLLKVITKKGNVYPIPFVLDLLQDR